MARKVNVYLKDDPVSMCENLEDESASEPEKSLSIVDQIIYTISLVIGMIIVVVDTSALLYYTVRVCRSICIVLGNGRDIAPSLLTADRVFFLFLITVVWGLVFSVVLRTLIHKYDNPKL